MSIMPPVPLESLTELSRAVDEHLADCGIHTRTSVFSLCIEAVVFGREGEAGSVATRARSAAHLLLELSFPDIHDDAIRELSIACERAALCQH
jgi:hypothetical protein